jgi:hypothetical protein
MRYKRARSVERLGLTLTAQPTPPPQLLIANSLAPLDLAGGDYLPLSDLVLHLLLFQLVTSSNTELSPLIHVPGCRSPSFSAHSPVRPSLYRMGRCGGRTGGAASYCTNILDLVVSWSLKGLPHSKCRWWPRCGEGRCRSGWRSGASSWCQGSLGSVHRTDGDPCHPTYHRHPNGAGDH